MLRKKLSDNSKIFILLLSKLSTRDRLILIDRFYKHRSMDEVAERFGITKPRIQQIEDKLINLIDKTFEYNELKL